MPTLNYICVNGCGKILLQEGDITMLNIFYNLFDQDVSQATVVIPDTLENMQHFVNVIYSGFCCERWCSDIRIGCWLMVPLKYLIFLICMPCEKANTEEVLRISKLLDSYIDNVTKSSVELRKKMRCINGTSLDKIIAIYRTD